MTHEEIAQRLEVAVWHANDLLDSDESYDLGYIMEDTLERMEALARELRGQAYPRGTYRYAYPMDGEKP